MRLVLFAFVTLATSSCSVLECPRGEWSCDGDLLSHCVTRCGGTKANPQCATTNTTTDCANDFVATLGVRKTCRIVAGSGMCLDAPLTSCDATIPGATLPPGSQYWKRLSCTPSGHLLSCYSAEGETFQDTGLCDFEGRTCLSTPTGPACVDSPKVACEPAGYPRCAEGARLYCLGGPESGYAVLTQPCGDGLICVTPDGGSPQCIRPAADAGMASDAGVDAGG